MGHIRRRLPQRGQAPGPSEFLAQHGHLTMAVSDFHTFLPEHLGRRLDTHVHGFVQAFEPLEDIVQSPCDDADFVQTVDRHAGVQLARCSPLHRLTHVRESSVHQQPCRLIHQERHEQDAAYSEPECRRYLTLHHADTEPPQRTDHDRGNGGDDEAEPDSKREFGHETRVRRVRPHLIAGNTCTASDKPENTQGGIADHESDPTFHYRA